jgi:hypothetical protein
MAACDRFNAIPGVQRGSEVRLQVRGDLADSETGARLESEEGVREFSEHALSSDQAIFIARRDFYSLTFSTKFLADQETMVELVVKLGTGNPDDDTSCTVSGKKGDPISFVFFMLEVE